MIRQDNDCIIIGSGLIGTLTAIALAQATSWRIALLEARPAMIQAPALGKNLDTRTLALNYASVAYLKKLNLWSKLERDACAIRQVHISNQGNFGSCVLRAQDVGYEALGYVIEINQLQKILMEHVAHYQKINACHEVTVQELKKNKKNWQIALQYQGQLTTMTTPCVILADGSQSKLRDQLNINCQQYHYQQNAIVAVAHCQKAHEGIAYERFSGKRTLAILPLQQQRIGIVLTVPEDELKELIQLSDADYLKKIQSLLGYRLGKLDAIGPRQSYPLQQHMAERFILDNLILLGNTAHAFNPIGAQGLNIGIAGIKDLVATLSSAQSLNDFELRQQARCLRLTSFTRQTVQIFSSDALLTQIGRQAALILLQHDSMLKNQFTRRMMGF
jgi:2-octaprenyl-6-methoxyphenol hydroxylase